MSDIKITSPKSRNHYWDSKGINQQVFDRLIDELMPAEGEAKTLHGELIRSANRLYHEYCNNGNINAVNYIYDRHSEEPIDSEMNPFFGKFLNILQDAFEKGGEAYTGGVYICKRIRNFIISESRDSYSNEYMVMYDQLIDYALLYIANTEDEDFQDFYN